MVGAVKILSSTNININGTMKGNGTITPPYPVEVQARDIQQVADMDVRTLFHTM